MRSELAKSALAALSVVLIFFLSCTDYSDLEKFPSKEKMPQGYSSSSGEESLSSGLEITVSSSSAESSSSEEESSSSFIEGSSSSSLEMEVSSSSFSSSSVQSSSSAEVVSSSSSSSSVQSSSSAEVVSSSSVSTSCNSWGEWVVTSLATCNVAGLKMRICESGMSKIEKEEISKFEWGEWEIMIPATPTTLATGKRTCPNGDIDIKNDLKICGTDINNVFAPEEQFCQSGTNAVKDFCGSATYTATQFCYNSSKVGNFCGINPQKYYNPDLYECKTGSNGIYLKNGITDSRDNNKRYDAVLIGTQTWMAENMNYDVPDNDTDVCYMNLSNNCTIYGKLYKWLTAMDVCPPDWHLPSNAEWDILTATIGDSLTGGKHILMAANGWNDNKNGADIYGFAALPGGFFNDYENRFGNGGTNGVWWTSSEYNNNEAYYRLIHRNDAGVPYGNTHKVRSFSVRCLKDN